MLSLQLTSVLIVGQKNDKKVYGRVIGLKFWNNSIMPIIPDSVKPVQCSTNRATNSTRADLVLSF